MQAELDELVQSVTFRASAPLEWRAAAAAMLARAKPKQDAQQVRMAGLLYARVRVRLLPCCVHVSLVNCSIWKPYLAVCGIIVLE